MKRFNIGYGINGWRPEQDNNGRYCYFEDADKYIRGLIKKQINLNQKITDLESEIFNYKFNDLKGRIG